MPNPLVLLAFLLPFDALMGGAATPGLVQAATLLCVLQAIVLPGAPDTALTPEMRQGAQAIAQRLRHPGPALLESAGVVATALLAPPGAALWLAAAALLALDARQRLAVRAGS
jgi:hypothetical protein